MKDGLVLYLWTALSLCFLMKCSLFISVYTAEKLQLRILIKQEAFIIGIFCTRLLDWRASLKARFTRFFIPLSYKLSNRISQVFLLFFIVIFYLLKIKHKVVWNKIRYSSLQAHRWPLRWNVVLSFKHHYSTSLPAAILVCVFSSIFCFRFFT